MLLILRFKKETSESLKDYINLLNYFNKKIRRLRRFIYKWIYFTKISGKINKKLKYLRLNYVFAKLILFYRR